MKRTLPILPALIKNMVRWTALCGGLLLLFTLAFCQKEKFTSDPADKLEFSTDTLRFDTVFTQLGSATRYFKIYNRHKESIRISRIFLEKGANSRYNLNIDGISGDDQENLEIAPNDSMYVFAEVTIDPNDDASPFVVDENVLFETNGNVQKVVLEAGSELTFKAAASFIKLDASGITMVGPIIKFNSGGAPGSGSGAAPLLPGKVKPADADKAGNLLDEALLNSLEQTQKKPKRTLNFSG